MRQLPRALISSVSHRKEYNSKEGSICLILKKLVLISFFFHNQPLTQMQTLSPFCRSFVSDRQFPLLDPLDLADPFIPLSDSLVSRTLSSSESDSKWSSCSIP